MIVPLLLAVDFSNFTYATNPCYKNVPVPAVMKKGSFSYYDQNMGAGFDLRVDSVTRGSLAPGTQQAVVVLVCDFPVGGTAEAYVFSDRGNSAATLGDVASANWGRTGAPDRSRSAFLLRNAFFTLMRAKTTTARRTSSRRTR